MAEPVDFPEANKLFVKPPSMTDAECGSLPVHDAGGAYVSCWKLSDEERAAIASGGEVWLWVFGRALPPVSLSGVCPFARRSS